MELFVSAGHVENPAVDPTARSWFARSSTGDAASGQTEDWRQYARPASCAKGLMIEGMVRLACRAWISTVTLQSIIDATRPCRCLVLCLPRIRCCGVTPLLARSARITNSTAEEDSSRKKYRGIGLRKIWAVTPRGVIALDRSSGTYPPLRSSRLFALARCMELRCCRSVPTWKARLMRNGRSITKAVVVANAG